MSANIRDWERGIKIRAKQVVLRKARVVLENSHTQFICWAIDIVQYHSPKDGSFSTAEIREAKDSLRLYIADALGSHTTYGSWLCENYPEWAAVYNADTGVTGRLQWIDWMIQDLQEQYDEIMKGFELPQKPLDMEEK